ncbi:MAG: bifunctional phosphoribosylaminoimidazolecarboxamide formyltransferase/IMP cyclohydrolase [Peptococcaceae bacterium]|nr:bifunctional phosphoribosylaminoimidazolecarboxamide formyltransferase/IMP cyclohydrolase [Peptococcaceae bacterium]
MSRRALLSVSDKTGLVEFARGLAELGFELVSTGGTFRVLSESGLNVLYISAVTEFPEILDGRVKTLHPRVHAGILAMDTEDHRRQCQENSIDLIDLVCVNLYPFAATITKPGATWADAIENIDIGGPAMIRAAAKNHDRVVVVVSPDKYDSVLTALRLGNVDDDMRRELAWGAFAHTAAYDTAVAGYFRDHVGMGSGAAGVAGVAGVAGGQTDDSRFPATLRIVADKIQMLRYGENPIQQAAVYAERALEGALVWGKQLQGKELSYNNWVDMDAAWALVNEFDACACAIIKHTNPCGLALGDYVFETYERALACDPVSAYGGIIAFNRPIDGATAEKIRERFYEVIIAPDFDGEALGLLSEKKNLRLFAMGREAGSGTRVAGENGVRTASVSVVPVSGPTYKLKSISGGFLLQDEDLGSSAMDGWRVVSALQPTQADLDELFFAWMACKHVKSNAIVVTINRAILGVGAGQMNRVGSARIALEQAGVRSKGAYLASDAYFPFADTVELAAQHAVRAIVQPGGSVRDDDAIDAADKLGLIMVFTDRRHFRH